MGNRKMILTVSNVWVFIFLFAAQVSYNYIQISKQFPTLIVAQIFKFNVNDYVGCHKCSAVSLMSAFVRIDTQDKFGNIASSNMFGFYTVRLLFYLPFI